MSHRVFAGLSLIILFTATVGAGAVPPIQVDNKPDPRIEIVPIDDGHVLAVPASLRNAGLALPPGSFILINRTGTAITAVVSRWTYTDAQGEFKQRGITCDAYIFAPLEPIVKANDLSLITPYGCTTQDLFPRLASGAVIGSSIVPTFGDPISVDPNAIMHLYIDSVIFEDGLIWGPDKSHYYTEIQERYSVVQKFVAEVTAARNAGEDIPTLAARIRKDAESKRDSSTSKASSRRAYYARLLESRRDAEPMLRQLRAQPPPPPKFRHTGG